MAIDKEVEAKILRYHFVDHWRPNTIAAQLSVHHSVVDRVLSQAGQPKAERARQPSIVDPYTPFIVETLRDFPRLTAARLYDMVRERGYPGGPSHFRSHIAQLRPRQPAEAYLRLRTLPGEQAQCDWAHFGHVTIGRAKRPLMAFVLVLSWSRQIFLRFYLDQRMDNFLRGHLGAFQAWGGLSRVVLYDNLKSAVLERRGDAIRFHPTLLALSAHYHFEPRPVAVARGNEKGRVERAIRFIRDRFFAGRRWSDISDLNAQADAWCWGPSADRPCPEDPSMTVAAAFEQERSHLLVLPDNPFPTEERVEVRVGKTPYCRFDLNDYSVPHTQVRRTVTVMATPSTVRILVGSDPIAEHARVYGKGEQIEDPAHLRALVNVKRQARHHRGQDRLSHAVPSSRSLLQLAGERGSRLSTAVSLLNELLDIYGAEELERAIGEALHHDVPHPNAVSQILERRREQRDQPPPLAIALPDNAKAPHIRVRPATLAHYDQLNTDQEPETPDDDNH